MLVQLDNKIPFFLTPELYRLSHNAQSLAPKFTHDSPVHTIRPYSFKTSFSNILHSNPQCPHPPRQYSIPFSFSTKILYAFLIGATRAKANPLPSPLPWSLQYSWEAQKMKHLITQLVDPQVT